MTGPRVIGQKQYEYWRRRLVGSVIALPVGIAAFWALLSDVDADSTSPARSVAFFAAVALLSVVIPLSPVVMLVAAVAGRKVLLDPPHSVRVKRVGLPPRQLTHVSHIDVVETVWELPHSARTPHPVIGDSAELEWGGATYRAEAELWARRVNRRWVKRRSIRLAAVDWPDRFRLAGNVAGPLGAGVAATRDYPVGE